MYEMSLFQFICKNYKNKQNRTNIVVTCLVGVSAVALISFPMSPTVP